MTMATWTALYALTIPVFFALDMLWLGFVAKGFYARQLNGVVQMKVNWTAAVIFYLVFIAGILYFAVIPALASRSLRQALLKGLLFGFFTYATYDLTNLATIKGWPLTLSLVDIAWGMVLCTLVAWASYSIGLRLG